jgi:hypothetical protein
MVLGPDTDIAERCGRQPRSTGGGSWAPSRRLGEGHIAVAKPTEVEEAVVASARRRGRRAVGGDTFGPFSFVAAAGLLVVLGVLALVRARAIGERFRLPFGDGTMIAAAGVWAG